MANRLPLLILTALTAAFVAGCGQKGPLYLPEEQTAPVAGEPVIMPSEQLPVNPPPRELGTPTTIEPGLQTPGPVPQAVIPLDEEDEEDAPEVVEEPIEPIEPLPPPGL